MGNSYLTTVTVPIPFDDRLVVIRDGEKVEYEVDRVYVGNRSTRVKRRTIGRVDPVQPGRMFPNENYFELFPENEVPEEVRDEFLRECAIRREMKVIRRNPQEVIDGVVRGLAMLNQGAFRSPPGTPSADCPHTPLRAEGSCKGDQMNYTMVRRVFDEIYYAIEELAGKFPNETVMPFKVRQINEVLDELRAAAGDGGIKPYLRRMEDGLTYSDAVLMMKWYKVLPR